MVFQLQQTQWWPEERLLARQLEQIRLLGEFARRTAPFYAGRLDTITGLAPGSLTLDAFRRVPVLKRADIQDVGEGLFSRAPPPEHGGIHRMRTSGSTGEPVHVRTTDVAGMMNTAVSLRYHLWHRRDFTGKNIIIKGLKSNIDVQKGESWVLGYPTGPSMAFNQTLPPNDLFDMVIREDPHYLQCRPYALGELIRRSRELGVKPGRLREVRTVSEVLGDELRRQCRHAWGVPVSDNYSSEEFGILAVQCPDHPWNHVQSEKVLLEVLDDEGRPCPPGKLGRVVVTALHNFATPLIRYDLGDYGELGPACPCGRGLPVLRRIAGRERNLVVLPTGEKIFPVLDSDSVIFNLPIRQYQMIQKTLEMIEMKLVVERPLKAAEERQLREYYCRSFGHPFRFQFVYVDEIARAASGKYEVFRSEVGG